ncbi:hypothetical protein [Ruminococcus sp. CAG:330]|uniref:hypothetical protein n=1 Tax=Ruminococcus sp. CAG:330 TaxID=1262954 RepID=UPI00263F7E3C|nr:hypothetical protein [Ruminococcus sp. CAG:330]
MEKQILETFSQNILLSQKFMAHEIGYAVRSAIRTVSQMILDRKKDFFPVICDGIVKNSGALFSNGKRYAIIDRVKFQ